MERVKTEGQSVVVLTGEAMRSTIESLEQVMNKYSLLRIRVKDKETAISEPDADIKTWYKVEILEALHQQESVSDEPLLEGVPSRLLPLLPSESILVVSGGEVSLDGMRIVHVMGKHEVDYVPGQEYIIASHLNYGGKMILPVAGSAGIFRVDKTNLKPLGHVVVGVPQPPLTFTTKRNKRLTIGTLL